MGLKRIESLPPEMQAEVADFVEYLQQKLLRQQEACSADNRLAPVKGLNGLGRETLDSMGTDKSLLSIAEVLASALGHLCFQSAKEVDAYLRVQRHGWGN